MTQREQLMQQLNKKYTNIVKVGDGASGVVYQATKRTGNKEIILKVSLPQTTEQTTEQQQQRLEEEERRQTFRNEVEIARLFKSKRICKVGKMQTLQIVQRGGRIASASAPNLNHEKQSQILQGEKGLGAYNNNHKEIISVHPIRSYQQSNNYFQQFKKEETISNLGQKAIYYYEMEKMDCSLLDFILELEEAIKYREDVMKQLFKEICKAVFHCHKRRVAHLDIKPENILLKLKKSGKIAELKLADFGCARRWNQSSSSSEAHFDIYTKAGTWEYMAPELNFRENHGAEEKKEGLKEGRVVIMDKADVYSLGVTLFTMLTGFFPKIFSEDGDLVDVLNCEEVRSRLSVECNSLLQRMMHDDPRERPSVRDILLDPFLN